MNMVIVRIVLAVMETDMGWQSMIMQGVMVVKVVDAVILLGYPNLLCILFKLCTYSNTVL